MKSNEGKGRELAGLLHAFLRGGKSVRDVVKVFGGEGRGVKWKLTDPGQLLQSLEEATSRQTEAQTTLEAVQVRGRADGELVVVVRLDFRQLFDDGRVIDGQAAELGEGLRGLLVAALSDQESRRLGQQQHAPDQDDGPQELHRDRDPVGPAVVPVLRGVVHDRGDEEADRDRPLVAAYDKPADPFRRAFALIQWYRSLRQQLDHMTLNMRE